jgi:hypothetical protein
MPTVFSAKLDGSLAVRYHHVSLVTFYLRQTRSRALAAAAIPPGEEQFSEALLAIICAALCLDAEFPQFRPTQFPRLRTT